MKSVNVFKNDKGGVSSTILDVPAPTEKDLAPDQVLIKVVVSGSNPKDWKVPVMFPKFDNTNTGDDIAGTIVAVGSNVTDFHPGDRVAAFHEMMKPWGSFAEYAIAHEHTTFHIPESTSFEEACTIPLACMTAVLGLYKVLGVPEPWVPDGDTRRNAVKGGVAVYGAASAVGAFAVKLLARSRIHPIICVAGNGADFVEGLIDRSKGDTIVDYRNGDDKLIEDLKKAIPEGETLRFAYDAITDHGSYVNLGKVLDVDKGSRITTVSPGKKYEGVPEGISVVSTSVGDVHWKDIGKEIGLAWFRIFGLGLKDGWLKGHPYEVVEGGLEGVGSALQRLMDGKISAKKVVFRISDTNGVSSE